jgi:hypothetical protein
MTPDMLSIYIRNVLKLTQNDIVERLKTEKGISVTQNQVARTLTGERPNLHLRKPIEEIIGMPGAFDAEFDAVAALRRFA